MLVTLNSSKEYDLHYLKKQMYWKYSLLKKTSTEWQENKMKLSVKCI